MRKFISYFSGQKWLNVIVAIVYYMLVVTTHKQVGRFVAQNLDKPLGRDNYNLLVICVGVTSLLILLGLLYRPFKNLLDRSEKRQLLLYLSFLVVLIIAAVNVIMVVNVEIIHIAQYCVMAILLYPLFKNFNQVMVAATILGALDEAYQYWYLFPEKSDYFDFNDVLINFLGVILGLIIIRASGVKQLGQNKLWYKNPIFYLFVAVAGFVIVGMYSGFITTEPSNGDSSPLIELVRKYKPGFWRAIPPRVKFHVVRPLEFVVIMAFLMGVFRKLGK